MNRYAVWKYLVLVVAVLVGLLYTVPNLYGDAPAVQVSAAKLSSKVDSDMVPQVAQALAKAGIKADYVAFEGTSVRARFGTTDTQLHARDVLGAALNGGADKDAPPYAVSLNLVPRAPRWMASLHALPMYLGLDLRGGVHFLMQVDMKAALDKKIETLVTDTRTSLRENSGLRDKSIRPSVARDGTSVTVVVHDQASATLVSNVLTDAFPDVQWAPASVGDDVRLTGTLKPAALLKAQDQAIKQNMTTLGNRVAGLGTSEPVIQQQGADRIVVELPGIQDTAKAKELIGRTATLEVHMVDESAEAGAAVTGAGPVPFGDDRYLDRRGYATIVKKDIVVSGDDLADAQPGPDSQGSGARVSLTMNAKGARIVRDVSRENIGKRMAILLFEKNKGEVVTAPTIRGELGERFDITGIPTIAEANDISLLLRSGALAAPMEFIEETAIGPSLGADNIAKGLHSVAWGFVAILVFMCAYYLLFGVISTLSLAVNLLLLVAVLSLIQTTLTLPGIAAIALTLGMAIDANVLVNERIREELRAGSAPQTAISAGYERAWATILDSNITTLIAGLSLLAFGSGAIKGFAIVHCLGILTSMFSAVFFSRGLVNLWYGRQKKLKSVLIGQVWKGAAKAGSTAPQPDDEAADAAAKRPGAAR
ncbi:MAG: protein translocase subunit SecD [Betaproteobacteria bacterium]